MDKVNIKIGGQAGEGIKVSGLILGRSLSRLGYSTFGYNEYPSLIRGGHNSYQIYAGCEDVFSQVKKVDILLALNKETISQHQDELAQDSLILYDPSKFAPETSTFKGKFLAIKFEELAVQAGAKPVSANMVSLACALSLLSLPITTLKEIISQEFKDKPVEVSKTNIQAAMSAQNYVNKNLSQYIRTLDKAKTTDKRMLITGNEAVALGALAGGLQFFSAYPMSPATSILHYLAKVATKMGIVVKHAEDEISVINLALGASFSGARSMVATSGGGLSLMSESIGLAGIAELPIVIINAQRPGPALGMPTWTAQGDLHFVLHIGNDEFPRIVLAPGDAQEGFELTKSAMNLAEKYQLPVIILLDKYFSENDYSTTPFTGNQQNNRYGLLADREIIEPFKRYDLGQLPVSPRSIPGQAKGKYLCNSYEHDEQGFGTEESKLRTAMMDKRMKKIANLDPQIPVNPIYGPKEAKIGIISWGSNKGVILEALKQLPEVNFLHLNWLWPFPVQKINDYVSQTKTIIVVEANHLGQLAVLLKSQTGVQVKTFLKYDGRPFYPEEIVKRVSSI